MNFFLKTSGKVGIVLILSAFAPDIMANANSVSPGYINAEPDSLKTEEFLKQASAIATKELLAANLAVEKGGAKMKTLGRTMILKLSQANEEIRNLAKLKNIVLPLSVPEGGQRPDGRVDAAPENLKDTTRHRNGGGEAGNTGHAASVVDKSNDVSVNKPIDDLKKLSGTAFDQAYMNMINTDHQTTLSLFERASNSSDSAIRKFAKKYLPVLRKSTNQL